MFSVFSIAGYFSVGISALLFISLMLLKQGGSNLTCSANDDLRQTIKTATASICFLLVGLTMLILARLDSLAEVIGNFRL